MILTLWTSIICNHLKALLTIFAPQHKNLLIFNSRMEQLKIHFIY